MKPKASDIRRLEKFFRERDALIAAFADDPETQALLEEGKDLMARAEKLIAEHRERHGGKK